MAKAIVKYINGTEKTGDILSLNINQSIFHLSIRDDQGRTALQTVDMNAVKAVYFPKYPEGGRSVVRTETIDQSTFAGPYAVKLVVEFNDGELIHGTAHKYNPDERGFFWSP